MNDEDFISAEAWNSQWGCFRHGMIKDEINFQPIPLVRYVRSPDRRFITETHYLDLIT